MTCFHQIAIHAKKSLLYFTTLSVSGRHGASHRFNRLTGPGYFVQLHVFPSHIYLLILAFFLYNESNILHIMLSLLNDIDFLQRYNAQKGHQLEFNAKL